MTTGRGLVVIDPYEQAPVHRGRRRELERLQEIEQQIQLAISGTATAVIAWQETTIELDVGFVNAKYQRYSNLLRPHFNYGVVSGDAIVVAARVVTFTDIEGRGLVLDGVTVAVGVFAPQPAAVPYTATVDLTFQGYGAPPQYPQGNDETD